MSLLFKNNLIKIEIEASEIPWLKIFTNKCIKEFSSCDKDLIEKEMIIYLNPEKINIASFGNYLPHVHFHIMARFKEDSFFPEPMWGKKQRETKLELPSFEDFYEYLKKKF